MTNPADSSTSRCCDIACRDEAIPCFIVNRPHSSNSDCLSRSANSSKIARLVGSAMARQRSSMNQGGPGPAITSSRDNMQVITCMSSMNQGGPGPAITSSRDNMQVITCMSSGDTNDTWMLEEPPRHDPTSRQRHASSSRAPPQPAPATSRSQGPDLLSLVSNRRAARLGAHFTYRILKVEFASEASMDRIGCSVHPSKGDSRHE